MNIEKYLNRFHIFEGTISNKGIPTLRVSGGVLHKELSARLVFNKQMKLPKMFYCHPRKGIGIVPITFGNYIFVIKGTPPFALNNPLCLLMVYTVIAVNVDHVNSRCWVRARLLSTEESAPLISTLFTYVDIIKAINTENNTSAAAFGMNPVLGTPRQEKRVLPVRKYSSYANDTRFSPIIKR